MKYKVKSTVSETRTVEVVASQGVNKRQCKCVACNDIVLKGQGIGANKDNDSRYLCATCHNKVVNGQAVFPVGDQKPNKASLIIEFEVNLKNTFSSELQYKYVLQGFNCSTKQGKSSYKAKLTNLNGTDGFKWCFSSIENITIRIHEEDIMGYEQVMYKKEYYDNYDGLMKSIRDDWEASKERYLQEQKENSKNRY